MRYRFETLLRLRKNQENLIQREMGSINSHLLRQKDRLESLEDITQKNLREFNQRMQQQTDPHILCLFDNFFKGSRATGEQQSRVIAEVEERAEAKRHELNEAVKKRRILEILKDRHNEQQKKIKMKVETALMDEIAGSRWKRKTP